MSRMLRMIIVTLAISPVAGSQVERSASGNAQNLQQLQQLAAERTQLTAENVRLKQELATLRKEQDTLNSSRKGAEQKAHALESATARAALERDSAQRELEQTRERLAELVAKFRETAGTLRDIEAERTMLNTRLTAREGELERCAGHNVRLYEINGEILTRLGARGFWTTLAENEVFTQLKRAELDNLVEDYRAQAEDHVLQPNSPH